ncbi:FAD binding domain-containing protein [Coniochaeta ligniaria NRRL 30616]|uniref:Delta(24)-sterol reductase n=1 Tax=Coniochaeta ligniaria NRRL 30616 TaxID=1408157 RepID=A0A1J7JHG4_9PEZI|nr:FAD binding domain-containing protein [Coniochaeta ligniaria NRRL 30616]
MEQHTKDVAVIASRVRDFYQRNVPFRVYHGSTNSTRSLSHDPDKVVDISRLSQVIHVDKERQTILAEPNVAMDQLVRTTLNHGMIPKVVPEFPGITVGGAFSGTAAESSSFKYGYFDRSINWVEIVLAGGDVVKASPTEHSDLFYGSIGACGTLGVCTLFEIQLIQSGQYVELTYLPVYSPEEAAQVLDQCRSERCSPMPGPETEDIPLKWDFVDGILFSNTLGAIIAGRIQQYSRQDLPVSQFSRRQDNWFYLHAHSQVTHKQNTHCDTCAHSQPHSPTGDGPVVELVPVMDYLFRYDRGAFWTGSYGWPAWLFNRIGRALLDPLFHTRALYRLLHLSGRAQRFIVQDLAVPWCNAVQFIEWTHEAIRIYPVWLCPVDGKTRAPLHLANRPVLEPGADDSFLNIGLWGVPRAHSVRRSEVKTVRELVEHLVEDNMLIEEKAKETGSLKWLYARNFYTEAQFWSIYNRQEYDKLRRTWGAELLPSLWDKVRNEQPAYVEEDFLGALLSFLLGRDHIMHRRTM